MQQADSKKCIKEIVRKTEESKPSQGVLVKKKNLNKSKRVKAKCKVQKTQGLQGKGRKRAHQKHFQQTDKGKHKEYHIG